ncbi:MAG: hypothetical protein A3J48_00585 [Candidatus Doudnabacteria bacterium RIFCSPHIGHO2_02_FULL_46_11]|uniref:Nucleotidyl transferase domain-containing protein n=1 Tax=Candidatus Doudnabacteria bacterium RIFCSPHIGHO2_02_FULL_46_11 TaxID=1817832 RepID=A0A1F5P4Z4_9BACT|nr:MAG: hypothetical protein A3J48_00585 [Candidatus Doudnabacteria bacterium RIFCSPHIGHO2_02_FULL_46_11]
MKAVLLAGGDGTRLRPITYEIPKPLVPVQNKPVIEYLVDNFLSYGCEEVILIINDKHLQHFTLWKNLYCLQKGIDEGRIILVVEEKPAGSFGALMLSQPYLKDEQSFFFGNGDNVVDLNLAKLALRHQEHSGVATVSVVQQNDPQNWGVAELTNDGKIRQFHEKPVNPPTNWINPGIYLVNDEIFDYYPAGKDFSMVEQDLWPVLAKEDKLYAYFHDGQFFGTDNIERWERAIKEYKHNPPKY